MSIRIEATVADQRGLHVRRLVEIIEEHYRTPWGSRVRVKVGRGVYVDGVPEGTLRLVDRGETD